MPKTNCQPSRPQTFNLTRSPLAGFNLIDASAGTGKTYTICSLVLRLLLEKELTIEQILVVTYTEAATEDLRDRIRQKLRHALLAVTSGQSDDVFLQEYLSCIDDYKTAEKRFSDALRSFDEAAIFTIHGFCQRMLIENSFESNALFDTELVADASYLIREIIEDFWRQSFHQSSKLFSEYAAAKITPDALYDFLGHFIPHPLLKFIPAIEYESAYSKLSDSESEYIDAYNTVCREWPAARNEVSQDLLNSKTLNRNKYRMATISGLLTSMDAMAAADYSSPYLFDKFNKLSSSSITSGTKTKEIPHILPFYDLCDKLVHIKSNLHIQYDRCLLAMKKRLSDSFMHEFNQRKKRANIYSFEDLLQRLHKALSGPSGSFLAETIARKDPAALIDEFQDTDPLQFEIFKAICKEKSLLFLIGDPKQAIYSFRGADIFTYMDAAAGTSLAHHTLGGALVRLGKMERGQQALSRAAALSAQDRKIAMLRDGILRHPDDPGLYCRLGVVYGQRQQVDEARLKYEQAVSLDPEMALALHNLGNIYLRERLMDNAVALFRRAVAADSTYVRGYNSLGHVHLLRGQYRLALGAYQRALHLEPTNGELRRNVEITSRLAEARQ